ncbi:MAG: MotA/TolQ/ExbB proton channel family protein [Verrucomicrobiales bacterium]|nr:MotA/TolQ/ExbB proton channel family protein [Verrucomicrobiales bacterium]
MFGNVVIEWFVAGGPIMWPILATALVAVCVVGERAFWWTMQSVRRDPETLEKVLASLEGGDFGEASRQSKNSNDPVLRMIWHGLNHVHYSLQGALQVAAGVELRKAGRFLTVMDTLVTLAPLLGLLGTVTGIMGSFVTLGDTEVRVEAVTGGIGEALIATACGLGIAIVALIPYNYFTSKVTKLQFELETAATNIEVMVNAAKLRTGMDTMEMRREAAQV